MVGMAASCSMPSYAVRVTPDPCDKHCPEDFKAKARRLLPDVQGQIGPKDEDLRRALLQFIGDFANWNLSINRKYLEISRGLVKSAHPEETPLVVDPFAGSGSIPLEALRLGCEAFASDLNPVACLILKVILEDIPRNGLELAEELQRIGTNIKEEAEKELDEFYPQDYDGSGPIAYLWARTVKCETSDCGAEIPLVRSFWLSKKSGRRRALRYKVIKDKGSTPRIELEIFEPKSDNEVPNGTVTRAKAKCPCCNIVLSPERVCAQLREQRGGADVIFDKQGNRIGGARLLAVVILRPNIQGRCYRLPTEQDYESVWNAMRALEEMNKEKLPNGLSPVPDEPLPPIGTLGFRVQRYGMLQWGDLFTARQRLTLSVLANKVAILKIDENVRELLAISLSKLAERCNSICDWMVDVECPGHLYTQQVIPPAWDFAESAPLSESSGSFILSVEHTAKNAVSCYTAYSNVGNVNISDARMLLLPDESCSIFFTDPPYYDSVPYSDLSDFFFVWLKRALPKHPPLSDPFDQNNCLTPKIQEAVQDEVKKVNGRPKDRLFFEEAMAKAFAEGRRILKEDGVGCVVFAHKTTEGWEALLSGMIQGGWTITGSWPITTERSARMRARESAALATSVHLVCRPRPKDAPVGDWGEVLRELPKRVGDWMERLQSEGIRGADLVFACIGPALEIYSKYSKVVDAQEREIPLGGDPESLEPHKRGYLAYVWEAVGRAALEQVLGTAEAKVRNGATGTLEEDARLTALFLWTLQSTNGEKSTPSPQPSPTRGEGEMSPEGEIEVEAEDDEAPKGITRGFSLVFDVARRFAQPLGIHLEEWEGRIIETNKGIVRLLSVSERAGQLFGEAGTRAFSETIENNPEGPVQLKLFSENQERTLPEIKSRSRGRKKSGAHVSDDSLKTQHGATTLDRVHAAMLLQADGRANALRTLLKAEQERSPDFLRLANALSALYPKSSDEKRLLDAMLLAVPR